MLRWSHDVETSAGLATPSGRSRVAGGVGARRQDAPARRAAGPDRLGRGRWAVEPRVGQGVGDQPPHPAAVAPALCRGRSRGALEGCAAPGPPQADSTGKGGSDRDGDVAHDAAGGDTLERAVDGPGPAGESGDGPSYLAGRESPAAPDADLQAESRSSLRPQTAGRGRALHESPRKGVGAERGREESDPGSRPHRTDLALAARVAGAADPRL